MMQCESLEVKRCAGEWGNVRKLGWRIMERSHYKPPLWKSPHKNTNPHNSKINNNNVFTITNISHLSAFTFSSLSQVARI